MVRSVVFGLLALFLAVVPAAAETRVPPTSRELIRLSFAPVVKKAAPAVVNVYSRRVVHTRSPFAGDPFFGRLFGDMLPFGVPHDRVQNSLGSGVILDPRGLIVTNHHVIQDATEVTVVLADRREFAARVLLSDERADLAVLKIDPRGAKLPVLEIGDSDQLEVGDLVLAIGNPFGVGQTVTSGIVSGLARTAIGTTDFRSFIQTDAAINPGNSGGALVDLDGRLVGINTAIFSKSGGSIGIGFAIPTAAVRTVLRAAANGGHIVRAWLGASGQPVTAELAKSLGLSHPAGVLIKDVAPDSPAAQAGLRIGDVILDVAGQPVEDPEGLRFRFANLPLDKPVRLDLWRDGHNREATVVPAPPPEQPPRDLTELRGRHPLSGATVGNLNPAFAEELDIDPIMRGVVVEKLRDGSPATRLGLEPGDVLASLDGQRVESVAQLRQLLATARSPWTVTVLRDDKLLSVTVR